MQHVEQPPDVQSFYSLAGIDLSAARCQGTACFVARQRHPERWREAAGQSPRVACLGKCYAAPATAGDTSRPRMAVLSRRPVVLERIADGGARTLDDYRRRGGLEGLRKALMLGATKIIAEIEASELRGRGGAGFPTGAKWRVAVSQPSAEKFVVANLDEGDPGAYIDRFIAEDDPYCLIEGMAIAACAVGAARGWIYARCEYPEAISRLQQALEGARAGGLLGERVLGVDFSFDVELVVGRGSYECGEETALLNSIEGRRPVARVRPPYVAQRGLFGLPTVVNNAETLANVPWIIRHGAEAYASLGIPGSRGTKVISLNSLFRRPGLYEIEFGVTLREIVEHIGGGLESGALKGLMIGGPLAGIVPPTLLDARFGFQELRAIGASVGHGGVVAFDEHTSIPELVHHVFSFAAYESCGLCTPCRLGAPRIEHIFASLVRSQGETKSKQAEWREIVAALKLASLVRAGNRTGGVCRKRRAALRRGAATMLRVTVNGKTHWCAPGRTVLAVLRDAAVRVPTLCDDPRLAPIGGCRLCLVEIQGQARPATACTTMVADGMEIATHNEQLEQLRRTQLRLLARQYPPCALSDPRPNDFLRWIRIYGLEHEVGTERRSESIDDSHPCIHVDMSRCIHCFRWRGSARRWRDDSSGRPGTAAIEPKSGQPAAPTSATAPA